MLERKASMLANATMVTRMCCRFITVEIQSMKDLMQSGGARVPKTVVPKLDRRRRRCKESLVERQP